MTKKRVLDIRCDPRISASLVRLEPGLGPGTLLLYFEVNGDVFGTGLPAPEAISAEEALSSLASALHTHINGYEFIPWPACSRHGDAHPMATESAPPGMWRCPDDDGPTVAIGHLGDA